MHTRELQDRIAAFPRWHYRFEFEGGVTTPVVDLGKVNRHEQRRRYFFDALLQVTGGSLQGRRVLDLGCNAGWWSLQAIEAGADFALGVDIRQMHVDQANLVFAAKGVDSTRYRFEQGDVFTHDFGDGFDVVLCLGLMEHVAKPVELVERMAATGAELLVIDTALSGARSSFFEVSHLDELDAHGELVLVPTREAVIELVARSGYNAVALARNITDYASMEDYRRLRRLAFICSRSASLQMLPREAGSPLAARWTTMIGAARRG
ncbi:MAG TPA: class I SAM-dependent methyltransferase [Solirubrobacteraceae bacterium]|nr:class I SAM-dependent methyltransferase [Solirubrobacteraceae bacterium]